MRVHFCSVRGRSWSVPSTWTCVEIIPLATQMFKIPIRVRHAHDITDSNRIPVVVWFVLMSIRTVSASWLDAVVHTGSLQKFFWHRLSEQFMMQFGKSIQVFMFHKSEHLRCHSHRFVRSKGLRFFNFYPPPPQLCNCSISNLHLMVNSTWSGWHWIHRRQKVVAHH